MNTAKCNLRSKGNLKTRGMDKLMLMNRTGLCSHFTKLLIILFACCSMQISAAPGPTSKPAELRGAWGDQGDGTFVNPVLPGDYSDLDAIRVGDDYYAISSTFQYSPGVIILHSKDLVNWRILGHAVDDITRIGPEMNWDRMDRYGRGVWAGSIRYHDGKFWIYFGTPDEGFFVTTATNPAGPWEPLEHFWKVKGWDDCCPFWDDDGQGYFICSNFADQYKIHLFKMSADGKKPLPETDRVIYQSKGSEANKLYKIGGIYYHYFSEVHSEGRVIMMNRSKSLDGPWEKRQLNHVNKKLDNEPNQGGLIELPSGEWWFFTHHGTGSWEGRVASLLPINWIDGWPVIGAPGPDGIGSMVWSAKKPISGSPIVTPQTDDEFDGPKISPQWEWNYQPRADKWSLTERPGFLRLHAFKPLKPNDLLKAGNTLTQRAMRTESNEVTVKLDIRGMADGQQAGLCHYAKIYSTIGVSQAGGVRTLTFNDRGKITTGPALTGNELWLRSVWGLDGDSTYSYSTDGKAFTPFGTHFQLTWGSYRGDRIGIFTFNDDSDAGEVDVDSFQYVYKRRPLHPVGN